MRKERMFILRTEHFGRMIRLDVRQTNSMPPTMGRQNNEECKVQD